MKKLLKWVLVTVMMALLCVTTAFAQTKDQSPLRLGGGIYGSSDITWNQNGSQWTCTINRTGEPLKNCWLAVYEKNGKYVEAEWYHFDENGIMQTGWFEDGGYTFYLRPSGRVVKGEGVETIDGRMYVFSYQHYVLKDRNITIDGKNYTTDENGCVISDIADKTLENPYPSGQDDQVAYLNAYRKQKGVSDLVYDSELTGVAKKAYDFGDSVSLSGGYSLASATGHNIRHIAYIRATASEGGSYVYLTEDAVAAVQNTWFTRVGYYKSNGTIMIIMAAYDREEAMQLSPEEAQGKWINENGRYKYRRIDGTFAANCWAKTPSDGKWYHFDENGFMETGWFQDNDGKWYYLSTDTGEMVTNTTIDGYVIGADGVMQ
ncbi:hypothetical protein H8S75_13250 [Hungatella sp. L12]|uniref:Cell wall-binding protein n=1 Tax=Hungatella hominis TaxID=2763050 RepID=A0ABR7H6T3_9FIRM|nr:hypothetical protein [Hungatella hominis]MBC5708920.1 hypothetical protein [Hungatella hominis]